MLLITSQGQVLRRSWILAPAEQLEKPAHVFRARIDQSRPSTMSTRKRLHVSLDFQGVMANEVLRKQECSIKRGAEAGRDVSMLWFSGHFQHLFFRRVKCKEKERYSVINQAHSTRHLI